MFERDSTDHLAPNPERLDRLATELEAEGHTEAAGAVRLAARLVREEHDRDAGGALSNAGPDPDSEGSKVGRR
jgi:hypothetical protein